MIDYLQSRTNIPQPSLPASQQDDVLHPSRSLQGTGSPRIHLNPNRPAQHPCQSISIRRGVKINKRTTLAKLHSHPLGTNLEYPETGVQADEAVGHLFELDPSAWERQPPSRILVKNLVSMNRMFCALCWWIVGQERWFHVVHDTRHVRIRNE